MPRKRKPRPKKTTRTLPLDAPGRKNLKPAKPGEVRNPTGKNGSEWLTAFREFFSEECIESLPRGAPERADGDTRYKVALKSLFRNVVRGSEQSIKLAFEQMQGKARQSVELTGKDGAPLAGDITNMTRADMQREIERLEALEREDAAKQS